MKVGGDYDCVTRVSVLVQSSTTSRTTRPWLTRLCLWRPSPKQKFQGQQQQQCATSCWDCPAFSSFVGHQFRWLWLSFVRLFVFWVWLLSSLSRCSNMLRNWKMKLSKSVTSISCNSSSLIQQHFPFYYRNRYVPRWRIQLALGICLGFLLAVLTGTCY